MYLLLIVIPIDHGKHQRGQLHRWQVEPGLSASLAVVTIGTYLLAYKTELGTYATAGVVFIFACWKAVLSVL